MARFEVRPSAYWLSRLVSVLVYSVGIVAVLRVTATDFDQTEQIAGAFILLFFVLVDGIVGLLLLLSAGRPR